jgi:hypothetical protein
LDFDHCRELFQRIRLSKQKEAVQLAQEYIEQLGTKN